MYLGVQGHQALVGGEGRHLAARVHPAHARQRGGRGDVVAPDVLRGVVLPHLQGPLALRILSAGVQSARGGADARRLPAADRLAPAVPDPVSPEPARQMPASLLQLHLVRIVPVPAFPAKSGKRPKLTARREVSSAHMVWSATTTPSTMPPCGGGAAVGLMQWQEELTRQRERLPRCTCAAATVSAKNAAVHTERGMPRGECRRRV